VSQRARTRPRPEAAEVGMPSERQVLFWLALLAFGYVFGFVGLLVRCNDRRASALWLATL